MNNEELQAFSPSELTRMRQELIASANIPKLYSQTTVTTHKQWNDTRNLAAARLVDPVPPGQPGALIMICGPKGSGKTQMAVNLLTLLATSKLLRIYFSRLHTFMARARETPTQDFYDQFWYPKILVLDEVLKISESPWSESQFFDVIEERFSNQRHTILTCAALPQRLPELLPPSVMDRLDSKTGLVLHTDWPSFR